MGAIREETEGPWREEPQRTHLEERHWDRWEWSEDRRSRDRHRPYPSRCPVVGTDLFAICEMEGCTNQRQCKYYDDDNHPKCRVTGVRQHQHEGGCVIPGLTDDNDAVLLDMEFFARHFGWLSSS